MNCAACLEHDYSASAPSVSADSDSGLTLLMVLSETAVSLGDHGCPGGLTLLLYSPGSARDSIVKGRGVKLQQTTLTLPEEDPIDSGSVGLLTPPHLQVGLDVDGRAVVSVTPFKPPKRIAGRDRRRVDGKRPTHPLPSFLSWGCWFSLNEKTLCHEVCPSV